MVIIDFPFAKDLLLWLRRDEQFEAMPAILLLAQPVTDNDVFEGYHFGGDLVLAKPVTGEEWRQCLFPF